MFNAILFDLDGTLLPMDMDAFERHYHRSIAAYAARGGHDAARFMHALSMGTEAMKQNDGRMTNRVRFQQVFSSFYAPYDEAVDRFIRAYFVPERYIPADAVRVDPYADKIVKRAKSMGLTVALATNPYSPKPATLARMRAAGLDPEDFSLITTMENSRFCKPNPAYYHDVLSAIGLRADQCLMVGNDVCEDMIASTLGCDVYLVTPCLINKRNEDIARFPNGTLETLYHRLGANFGAR
jgi:FMN phosphatase YigB (HAD superfamily)